MSRLEVSPWGAKLSASDPSLHRALEQCSSKKSVVEIWTLRLSIFDVQALSVPTRADCGTGASLPFDCGYFGSIAGTLVRSRVLFGGSSRQDLFQIPHETHLWLTHPSHCHPLDLHSQYQSEP